MKETLVRKKLLISETDIKSKRSFKSIFFYI